VDECKPLPLLQLLLLSPLLLLMLITLRFVGAWRRRPRAIGAPF